jgi:hypothetical protein
MVSLSNKLCSSCDTTIARGERTQCVNCQAKRQRLLELINKQINVIKDSVIQEKRDFIYIDSEDNDESLESTLVEEETEDTLVVELKDKEERIIEHKNEELVLDDYLMLYVM